MSRKQAAANTLRFLALASSGLILSSCGKEIKEGMVIFTQTTGEVSHIVAIDPEQPERSLKVLSGEFQSARSPEVSYDSKSLLFASRHKKTEPWQISWMDLNNLDISQITNSNTDCSDPAWLPGGQIIFSKNDTAGSGKSLYFCNPDGSDMKRITFDPYSYESSMVLRDGRILAVRRYQEQLRKDEVIIVLRPDGTKAGLFYKGPQGSAPGNSGKEDSEFRIFFIESDNDDIEIGDIVSINYNRPLHSRKNLTANIDGSFQNVFPSASGKIYVSYQNSDGGMFSLCDFDEATSEIRTIYGNSEWDASDPVVVEKRIRPKKLPSEVDVGAKTGLLLCQDINFTGIMPLLPNYIPANADRIKVIGRDSILGIVDVEKDGSFYLKVVADTPFRIQTIDSEGKLLNGPSGWIYLRPNERRGCVGCHESPEMVPENRLPFAVKKPPVSIPVNIKNILEKEILLE